MTITLAVLGDSIAFGQGASRPRDTIGERLVAMLDAENIDSDLHVLAVPGAVSAGLAAQTERAVAIRPDVAVVIIGANDLTHFVPPLVAAEQLGSAVEALAGVGATVVVTPAPDMSALPAVPPQLKELVRAASAVLQQAQARVARSAGARVIDPRAGLGVFADDPTLLSHDRFHPSSAGYAVIAAALGPAVLAAAHEVLGR